MCNFLVRYSLSREICINILFISFLRDFLALLLLQWIHKQTNEKCILKQRTIDGFLTIGFLIAFIRRPKIVEHMKLLWNNLEPTMGFSIFPYRWNARKNHENKIITNTHTHNK